jgi:hypothetical protein
MEMDSPRSDIDDCIGSVEEWSSQDDGWIIFFFHVQDHEVSGGIVIMNLDHYVLCYAL